jgi:hypothetical protein
MRTVIIAAALAALAAPAFAGANWTASPAQASSKTGIIAAHTEWDCDSSGCHTTSDTTGADALSACRDLARTVGPLTAFTSEQPFNKTRLDHCNAAVASPKAQASR